MSDNFTKWQKEYAAELTQELLGEGEPYVFIRKREYDYLAVHSGFVGAIDDFLSRRFGSVAQCPARPLVVHVSDPLELVPATLFLLKRLRSTVERGGSGMRIYPSNLILDSYLDDLKARHLVGALLDLGVLKRGQLSNELVEVFCVAARTVFDVQTQVGIHFIKPELRVPGYVDDQKFSGVTDIVGGGLRGTAILTMGHASLYALSARMLRSSRAIPDMDIWSVACEMINIVAGFAKSRLNDMGYSLSLFGFPSLITPEFQPVLSVPDTAAGVIIRMSCEFGHIDMELRFLFEESEKAS